jgi:hypothetical protein
VSSVRPSALLRAGRAAVAVAALALTTSTGATPAVAAPDRSAATAVAAGTSGSIVYIRYNNVYLARGDGTAPRRITTDGTTTSPYRSPSESDSGVIAAAHGTVIVRMTQAGTVLNTIDPPALKNSAGESMDGAVNDVALSPDGTRIAWSFVQHNCPVGTGCQARFATGYTTATKLSSAGRSTFYRAASWVTDTRTLQTGGYGSQVMLHDLTSTPRHWFDDRDYASPDTDLADGELAPNGTWLAEVRGYGASSAIIWYRVSGNARTGNPPAVPTYTCYTNGEAEHASPTWSPDSTALAWAGRTGIWIKRDAASCSTSAPTLVLAGGSSPDWSPATLR